MQTNDGKQLTGASPEALVAELHNMSFTHEKNDRQFMYETAGRILATTGRKIRYGCAEEFVEDLLKIGFLHDNVYQPEENSR